jgi:vacuolar-type H+-ATPase subunit I/STV1
VDELTSIADRLYAGPADAFTDARNAAARDCGDKALAARIKQLKKPSVAAWAVNLLVRRESGQIDSVLELGESLRAAAEALDGDELRALTRQRRQLTTALATSARSLAGESGARLTGPVVEQVERMLNAAMLDPVAARVVRTGRVLIAFASTGVSELDVESVVALPEALDVRAVAVEAPVGGSVDDEGDDERAPVGLHVVPDDGVKVAAAEEALEEATGQVAEAEHELAEVDESVESLNARRLQLQGEADELRRRLAAIEDDVDQVDDELEEACEARDAARGVLEEARRTQTRAEEALARLRDQSASR